MGLKPLDFSMVLSIFNNSRDFVWQANSRGVPPARDKMFSGEKINFTEVWDKSVPLLGQDLFGHVYFKDILTK